MKIALTADWLVTYGGAEHVLAELHALYPDAPIFTSIARRQKIGPLQSAQIHTSRLQHIDRLLGKHQLLLPWMPSAMESLDVRGYDVVLSSSHAVGKGILPDARSVHVCYCHTPMRYAWEMEDEYIQDFRVPRHLRKRVKQELARLRRWDMSTAKRVDVFIANSRAVQERIARIYGRESFVVPPPVQDRFFLEPIENKTVPRERYLLAIGRMVPYKRFDLLIETANRNALPLWIAGSGQDEARLRKLAGPTVRFLGYVPDAQLPSLYAGAEAFLFPQLEDAGIAALEASACGTPVVAFGQGGALDAVADGRTGIFFSQQSVASLSEALTRMHAIRWDRNAIRSHAEQFSQARFRNAIAQIVQDAHAGHILRKIPGV